MGSCHIPECDGDEGLAYRCNECGELICSSHRLPENHACIGLLPADDLTFEERIRDVAAVEGTTPDGIDLSDDQILGTTSEPDYESSPDVAVDGSIKRSGESTGPDSDSTGLLGRLRVLLLGR